MGGLWFLVGTFPHISGDFIQVMYYQGSAKVGPLLPTMGKFEKIFSWVGIAALIIWGGNKLSEETLKRISYGIPKLKIKRVTIQGLEVQVIMPITNKTPVGMPLDSLAATVWYGTNRITDFGLTAPVIIQSQNTTSLVFDVRLDYAQLASSVENVYNSQEWLQYLRVEGTAISNGIRFPFNQTFQLV